MTRATATVDLVRFDWRPKRSRWHILDGDTTLCNTTIPEAAKVERGLDARVVQFRGAPVCGRCLRRLP